jgi:hypothetical protein
LNIYYTMSSSPRPSLLPFHQSVGIISVMEMLKIIYGKYCIENGIQSKRMWSVVCSFFTDYFICNSSSTNSQESYLQFISNQVRRNQTSVQQVIASTSTFDFNFLHPRFDKVIFFYSKIYIEVICWI